MDEQKATQAVRDLLAALDIDLEKDNMEKTPARVVSLYKELFSGKDKPTAPLWGELFEGEAQGLVAVKKIPFVSMCEHHLVPFFGEVSIAYIPSEGKVAGFSKFAAVVKLLSSRPQLQERLTKQIADAIENDLNAKGVLVIVEARQLCLLLTGSNTGDVRTLTTEGRGELSKDSEHFSEAVALLMKEEKVEPSL